MSPELVAAFDHEWALAAQARARADWDTAFRHLERAHILGQRSTRRHVRSHVAMLSVGWRRRDGREIRGQLARIVAALLFSRVWVPVGNTGGADVPATRPMPLPDDLRALVEQDRAGAR